jgi:polar amino acid transport system substrate-binding protein
MNCASGVRRHDAALDSPSERLPAPEPPRRPSPAPLPRAVHLCHRLLGTLRRRAFLANVSLLAAALVAGCSPSDSGKRLVVGMELGYPPFEMKDEKGNPAGVSVDLAGEIAKTLGRELVIENITFDGLIPALKTGKIDLILSSMTRTEERSKSIAFSETYVETGLCLLAGKASTVTSITNLDEAGRKVAVKKGTTGHAWAVANLKHAETLVLDQESAAVLEVVQGKADAFIYDQMSVYRHWQRNPDATRALLQPFQKERWAIGLRQGNEALLEQVNNALMDFRRSAGFEKLGDRWLKEEKAAFKKLKVVFVF